MPPTGIYVLVEGDDDKRFFENSVLKSALEQQHGVARIVKYSSLRVERLAIYMDAIRETGAQYVFVRDRNNHRSCIRDRKEELIAQYSALALDAHNIQIVVHEIESWYCAGLDEDYCKKSGLALGVSTEHLTKSYFDALFKGRFVSRIACLVDMGRHFSLEMAKKRNASFAYFCRKFLEFERQANI